MLRIFLLTIAIVFASWRSLMAAGPEAKAVSAGAHKANAKKSRAVTPLNSPPSKGNDFSWSVVDDFQPHQGWRWVYRKKAASHLKGYVIEADSEDVFFFKDIFGLSGADRNGIAADALKLAAILRKGQEGEKAALIEAMAAVASGAGEHELESMLATCEDNELKMLGYFLIASSYERKGFYSEASGHYSRIAKDKNLGLMKTLATFRKGRLLFFDGRFDDAKEWLLKASNEGAPGAGLWLADAMYVKGELEGAWEIYSKAASDPEAEFDLVTRMSMADASLEKKDFESGRKAYEGLLSIRASGKMPEMLSSYLNIRIGDSYLLDGKTAEAKAIYAKTRDSFKGEARSIAALALADALTLETGHASWEQAVKIYGELSEAGTAASEFAHLSKAAMNARLENYPQALTDIGQFIWRYAISPFRADANHLKGLIAYRQIDALYSRGDYYGAASIYIKVMDLVPFGRKAETYLKAGKSLAALSLYKDAAPALAVAHKLGRDHVAEEALLELSKVYLAQGDFDSAGRTLAALKGRFPEGASRPGADALLLQIAFMKGEYKKAAEWKLMREDALSLVIKARSLSAMGSRDDSVRAYALAIESYGKEGKAPPHGLYIAKADAEFALKRYDDAAKDYMRAVPLSEDAGGEDRAWALYRAAKSYSMLGAEDEARSIVDELKADKSEFGRFMLPVFAGPPEGAKGL